MDGQDLPNGSDAPPVDVHSESQRAHFFNEAPETRSFASRRFRLLRALSREPLCIDEEASRSSKGTVLISDAWTVPRVSQLGGPIDYC